MITMFSVYVVIGPESDVLGEIDLYRRLRKPGAKGSEGMEKMEWG